MEFSGLNKDIVVQKGHFELLGNTHNLVYYPTISPQKKEVYRVETLDMGNIPLTHWCQ